MVFVKLRKADGGWLALDVASIQSYEDRGNNVVWVETYNTRNHRVAASFDEVDKQVAIALAALAADCNED